MQTHVSMLHMTTYINIHMHIDIHMQATQRPSVDPLPARACVAVRGAVAVMIHNHHIVIATCALPTSATPGTHFPGVSPDKYSPKNHTCRVWEVCKIRAAADFWMWSHAR